ncbi:MAG: 30S ribosomal protein S17e [Candidatus Bathyarchaeota archaeon]|nr:30S ribosomal protein S17e [Candidatus Bathyarchaeota archaeon]
MGNVRSEKVKRIAKELLRRYPDKFTADFEDNKKLVASLVSTPSKSLRNTITGYITSLVVLSQSRTENHGRY